MPKGLPTSTPPSPSIHAYEMLQARRNAALPPVDHTPVASSSRNALTPSHTPPLPLSSSSQPQYPAAQASTTMDEDAQELANLLKMQDRLRNSSHQSASLQNQNPIPSTEATSSPSALSNRLIETSSQTSTSPRSTAITSRPPASEATRKAQAIAYLESIPVSFLQQIHSSLKSIQTQTNAPPKRPIKVKKRFEDNECQVSGEEPLEGSSGVEEQRDEIGITMELKNRKTGQAQVAFFPDDPLSTSKREPVLHRMACIMRVASLLLEAIVASTTTTKRDIYYKDVALFKTQSVVDRLVDDIVATAGLKRQDFHVTATSKGLIASSSLEITMKQGGKLSLSSCNAALIPPIERIGEISASNGLQWVLVVEKDAVFQILCSSGLLDDHRLGPGALITGKGYPDLATLQLLHRIASDFPSATICVLVDADPHGLDILSVYTYGSKATTYSHDYANLALRDRVNWIGVTTQDWQVHGVEYDMLLPLTEKDVQKAMAMLRKPDLPAAWRRELSRMLHLDRKAEIQIISSISAFEDDGESVMQGEVGARLGRTNSLVEYVVEKVYGLIWNDAPRT